MSQDASIRDIRLDKLARLRELGFDPFGVERFYRTDSARGLIERFAELGGELEEGKPVICFAGRLASQRLMGKAAFAHISDGDGKVQAYFKKDELGEAAWDAFQLLDIGDHVGVEGTLFTTKTGEKSIHVTELTVLSKALQPLPLGKEKDGHQWYGLEDVEQRYRHRHLDLVTNAEAREVLLTRSRIVRAVREYFDTRGFFEVETPILQLEAGGAAARTFNTHYNAYDLNVKLRISLELYLKRIICGDVPKVYEIGRVFRNEGVSNRHNPEFTLLEWYEAYANLEDVMTTVEELFRHVAGLVNQPQKSDKSLPDFSGPWRRVQLLEEIERHTGLTSDDLSTLEKAKRALGEREVKNPVTGKRIVAGAEANLGGLIEKLLEVFVEPTLIEPTFVVGYPIETSPLAKKDPERPGFTRRFEGYVLGREICNAFSEINDPIDQRERFEHQVGERSRGDEEAHPMDEEFLYALECGMPPTGGCGIGIDRMAMLLTGSEHLREVLMFPMMKPN
ncbi:MAG: lysine--tRNA ligase [Chthonomonadaceae bacterium]|nr:lysine--tRNA ligase [Chthonomonadaceae bacterium]